MQSEAPKGVGRFNQIGTNINSLQSHINKSYDFVAERSDIQPIMWLSFVGIQEKITIIYHNPMALLVAGVVALKQCTAPILR